MACAHSALLQHGILDQVLSYWNPLATIHIELSETRPRHARVAESAWLAGAARLITVHRDNQRKYTTAFYIRKQTGEGKERRAGHVSAGRRSW
jgi:hypothetical protein